MISCSCIQLSVAYCVKSVMMYFVVVISLADSLYYITRYYALHYIERGQ